MRCCSSISLFAVCAVAAAASAGCSPSMSTGMSPELTRNDMAAPVPSDLGLFASSEPAPAPRVPQVLGSVTKPGQPVSLTQTVVMALAQNPEVSRALAEIHRSRGDVVSAQSAWFPKATYASTVGTDRGSPSNVINAYGHSRISAGLEVNQLLFDFGRADGQIDATRAVRDQRDAELHDTEERVALTATEAHLELIRAHHLVAATDHYLTALVNLRTAITLRANSGVTNQSDVLVADSRVQSARAERIRSQTRFISAQSKLQLLTGVQLTHAVDPGALLDRIARATKASSRELASGVAAADRAAAAALGRLKTAQASIYPAVGIKVTETLPIADKTITSTSLVGFTIQGDLFTGGAAEGRIKAAMADAQSAERGSALARLTSKTEIEGAMAEVNGAAQRAAAYARQLATVRQARELALAEYAIGKRTLTEVLNMEQEIFRAETDRITAGSDRQASIARAASVGGVLVASLLQTARN